MPGKPIAIPTWRRCMTATTFAGCWRSSAIGAFPLTPSRGEVALGCDVEVFACLPTLTTRGPTSD